MKTFGICAMLALAALGTAPVMATGPAFDKAVAMASQESGAHISDISLAVYNAVKESPAEADAVLSQVLAKRTTWTSGEVYAILRAVLLARPDVADSVRSQAASFTPNNEATEEELAAMPMQNKLLTALYGANLADGVLPAVVNALVNNTSELARINQGIIEGYTVGGLVRDADLVGPRTEDIPTPGPMSPQN